MRSKAEWERIIAGIHRRRPSTAQPEWARLLDDPDRLASVLRDTIRLRPTDSDATTGPRDMPELDEANRLLRDLTGDQEYTCLPFTEALANLVRARGWSVRQLARRINVSHQQAHCYMTGTRSPALDDMGLIAEAFGKPQTYFREYRALVIAAEVAEAMNRDPDRSAAICNRMR